MLKNLIENYKPYNEQEVADKEFVLELFNVFDDLLTRDNKFAHFTASNMVFNKTRDKVLMIYHNIYNSWGWTGGHADGDSDLFNVAQKELQEETGITKFKPLTRDIFALDVGGVIAHVKRGKFVSAHMHLNATYVFEADEQEILTIKADENSNVAWINISDIEKVVSEPHMLPIYNKIISKVKSLNL